MSSVGAQDLAKLLKISHISIECKEIGELGSQVLPLMHDLFQAESSIFILTRGPRKAFDYVQAVRQNFGGDYFSNFVRYEQHYHRLDPFSSYYNSSHSVLTYEQFTPYRVFTRSEYYNDFLKPQGLHYAIIICLKYGEELLGTVALGRPATATPFNREDKAKAELLAPGLGGALIKVLMEERTRKHKEIITSIAFDLPFKGVIILDEFYDPIYMNHEATNLISFLSSSEISQERLFFSLPEEITKLCEETLIPEDLKKNAKPITKTLKIGGTKKHVSVHLALLRNDQETPRYIICLEPHEPLGSFSRCLKRLGLSRREIEVAYLAYEGYTNNQIADRLFISNITVEKHLYSIFNKSGVNNRTSFARLITQFEHKIPLGLN